MCRCWRLSATQKWSGQYGIATDTPILLSPLTTSFRSYLPEQHYSYSQKSTNILLRAPFFRDKMLRYCIRIHLISGQCKCPLFQGLDIKLITKCKTVREHAMQAQTGSGGITHTLLTSAPNGDEWSASRPQSNLNPHHFVVKRNPLNPPVRRSLYLSCGHHRTSSAAPSKRTAPVIICASHCNKHIIQDATLTDTHQSSSAFIHSAGSRW